MDSGISDKGISDNVAFEGRLQSEGVSHVAV